MLIYVLQQDWNGRGNGTNKMDGKGRTDWADSIHCKYLHLNWLIRSNFCQHYKWMSTSECLIAVLDTNIGCKCLIIDLDTILG